MNFRRFYHTHKGETGGGVGEEIEHQYGAVRGGWEGELKSEGEEEGESIHPVYGISRRNQFLIWPSGWQSWRANSATMDLITQNCPRERGD